MNRYLEKIAAELPYRKRVEVIIVKDGQILVTKNKNKETGDEWFGFPGGGLDGKGAIETAEEECMEEVGVKVNNVKKIDVPACTEEGISKKDNRHLKFRGSITTWYIADYDQIDKSKLGDDGDSRKYRWRSLQEALGDVKGGKGIPTHRESALKALKGSNRFLEKLANLSERFQPDVTPDQMKNLGVLAAQYNNADPKTHNYFKVNASMVTWPEEWKKPRLPYGLV
jgi:8-oxo-dGTP pyrophosphatase MutT (NUDIX family)